MVVLWCQRQLREMLPIPTVIEKAVSAIAETSAKARQGSLKKENEHPIFFIL